MWGRQCVAFLPSQYYYILVFVIVVEFLAFNYMSIGIIIALPICILTFIGLFLFGYIMIRRDSFIFDIFVCKYFELGSTKHSFSRKGNIYYSSRL